MRKMGRFLPKANVSEGIAKDVGRNVANRWAGCGQEYHTADRKRKTFCHRHRAVGARTGAQSGGNETAAG